MAHCIYCGEKNPAGAVFCLACGITLYQEPKPAVANEVKKPIRWLIPVGLTSGLVVLILMVLLWKAFERKSSDSAASRSIIASAAEAVLTIIVYDGAGNQKAQGSGFILATDGLAATNFHVLAGAQRATAECCNGRKFEIDSIEGVNSDEDLVVFQLHETGIDGTLHNLPTVTLDTTGDVSVGEKVIAIGSPQGLENTVSDGIVSAIRSDMIRSLSSDHISYISGIFGRAGPQCKWQGDWNRNNADAGGTEPEFRDQFRVSFKDSLINIFSIRWHDFNR